MKNCPECFGRGYTLHLYSRGPGSPPGNRQVPCKRCAPETAMPSANDTPAAGEDVLDDFLRESKRLIENDSDGNIYAWISARDSLRAEVATLRTSASRADALEAAFAKAEGERDRWRKLYHEAVKMGMEGDIKRDEQAVRISTLEAEVAGLREVLDDIQRVVVSQEDSPARHYLVDYIGRRKRLAAEGGT